MSPTTAQIVRCNYPGFHRLLNEGSVILLNDGRVQLEAMYSTLEELKCRVIVGGELGSRKGVNVRVFDSPFRF